MIGKIGNMSRLKKYLRNFTVFSAICVSMCAFTFAVDAKVDASALKIRTETNTDCAVIATVKNNATLDVTGKMGAWYSVNYNGSIGYVCGEYLKFADGVTVSESLGTVTGASVNVRNAADISSPVVTKLLKDPYVNVLAIEHGWYKVAYKEYVGYIHPDYLLVNGIAYSYSESPADTDISESDEELLVENQLKIPQSNTVSELRSRIVEYAKSFLGVKYVYGGASPNGFDCSGFTQYVYKEFNYDINRSSAAQAKNGTAIEMSELQPGDLVLFSRGNRAVGHAGIYIGDGNFIHATSPGGVVSITPLNMKYYANRFAGARRIINE